MDNILKIVQIAFYLTGGTIAILTYIKAKKGLLNTINTEYQKKALVKVEEISDFLISEFDENSDNSWIKQDPTGECVKKMLEKYEKYKDKVKGQDRWSLGIPDNPVSNKLSNWVKQVKSDPFVPKKIREIVVKFIEERADNMLNIHLDELRKFGDDLIKNPEDYEGEDKDRIGSIVHNRINSRLYESGCGISQIEEKIHEVRLEIQKYYEKYDPIK
ncbi:MAG: hypothetical protein KQH79_11425 [Bacteroidetes bacterium]|nr:hypothetical protein [Bacteroidota bacterium]